MKANPRLLYKVFRPDLRLVIPLFQRPYVWTEDDQWAPLWEDVVATYDRLDTDTPPHFLGAIVLEQRPGELGTLEVREVIDGQQRLTTLQILITALRDSYVVHDLSTRLGRTLTKKLENDVDYATTPEERYKLWPTNQDRAAFRQVLDGVYRVSEPPARAVGIVGAYRFFRMQIDLLIAPCRTPDDIATVLDRLTEVLLEHLELVVIDLGEDDNAQVIFESLNARGTPLRASDLIKNALFRTLQSRRGTDVEALYTQYWQQFETEYWREEIRVGRLHRPRLDIFVGYFLTVLLRREILAHQLFPSARTYFAGDHARATEFLMELARYGRTYEGLDTGSLASPVERASLTRLGIADTSTIRPPLLWLFANASGAERERAVVLLESFLVRRSLCRLTPKNYNRLFLELLKELASGDGPVDVIVQDLLVRQTSESGLWPTDGQVTRSLTTLPMYRLIKGPRLQQLLLALDAGLTTDRTEPGHTHTKLSVDHLMPQSWESSWPITASDDAEAEAARREEVLHTIGNLTLVTGKLNAALSNRAWHDKRADILRNSALSLNRALPEVWDCAAIEARSNALAALSNVLWPRPDDAVTGTIEHGDQVLTPDRDTARESSPRRASAVRTRELRKDGTTRYQGQRRDIAAHVRSVFRDLPVGAFLSTGQISKTPSAQYPADDPVSTGAVQYRLFPPNGSACTIPGIEGAIEQGVRGGRKVTE
ncbi:DUF262 domain-containing protein [Gordonia sp. (in: high G+C Gram-positive bacteria)]|uniref:DUF262 domain-containing protein n=1 Tax=Gordonia sp. (in: high G+C Gram-positive bacteria) TaxID=84139 RepID=UPI0035294800